MSKTRDTGFLGNVVKYDANGNISLVSGSTTLMYISSSGAITTTGVISGSNVLTASYANNAETLDGLDSTVFTLTSSFNTTSASLYTVSSSAYATSGSLSATSGSLSAASGSLSAASGSFNTRVTALEVTGSALSSSILSVSASSYSTSGSLSSASGSFNTRISTVESKYATTGSNTFIGTQTITGSVLQSGSFTSTGTLTAQTLVVQTITSSVVYSSGSNIFGNAIGNTQTFTGSVLVTGSLTIAGGSSATSYSGATIYGSTAVCSPVGKFTTCIDAGSGTFSGTIQATTFYDGYVSMSLAQINRTAGFVELQYAGAGGVRLFGNTAYPITFSNSTGAATFSSTITGTTIYGSTAVCSPVGLFSGCVGIGTLTPCSVLHVYGVNPSLIIQNSNTATVGNTSNIVFRNLLSTGCIHFAGYIAGIQQSTSANTGDLSFNAYNNGSVVEGMRITAAGCVGIGTNTPCSLLHVEGQATIGCSTYRTRIEGSSAGTWVNFGTLACSNFLGRIGTFDSSYVLDSNNGNISFRFGGTEKSYINSSGQLSINGATNTSELNIYAASQPQITFQNAGANRAYISANSSNTIYNSLTGNGHAFQVDGNTKISITGAGSLCITCGNIFMPGSISGRTAMIEMPNSQTCDILGMPNLSSTFYLSYSCNSLVFRNDSGGSILTMYCNKNVLVGGTLTSSGIQANGSINGGTLYTTTQRLTNTVGNYANMVHKIQGAAGSFSQVVICVSLNGAGGWGYIINSGGTSGGYFQSGGGYTNGTGNYSHSAPVGSGYTVSSPANDVIRFVGPGGVHPFTSIQMFGSLAQDFGDQHVCIYFS